MDITQKDTQNRQIVLNVLLRVPHAALCRVLLLQFKRNTTSFMQIGIERHLCGGIMLIGI